MKKLKVIRNHKWKPSTNQLDNNMKLSVSAYRAHATARQAIRLQSKNQTHYGSTAPSQSSSHTSSGLFSVSVDEPWFPFFSVESFYLMLISCRGNLLNSPKNFAELQTRTSLYDGKDVSFIGCCETICRNQSKTKKNWFQQS